ncbi:hypothetical protein [Alkalilimnicola ehrlichii]|uniref:hypothetical protein n=1 Tax=Alkalilimnicola ehrlichii TaxID=351052 RepID=UPI0011C0759A|nr:hypothetical protein [Alkalilimnicola ehrlichii]
MVVITDSAFWQTVPAERHAVEIEADDACQFLWQALQFNGTRIGEVACNCEPEPTDYLLYGDGDVYRLAAPLTAPARVHAA